MQNKALLRKKYFFIRKKRYFEIKPTFFRPLIKLIKKRYKKSLNFSIYYPSYFEVNVLKLFESNISKKIKILLPVITSDIQIQFHKWKSYDALKINKFGMLEPYLSSQQIVPDVMLVPLLAFDKQKNRLGYGKGFYDKYLIKYLKRERQKKILSIGIAFSFQKHHKLPVLNSDVKLDFILTEKGLFK